MSLYWRVLRHNPDFSKLWLAQVVSLTGDWFNTVVLSALVLAYSGGSGVAISLFLLARFIPPLIVSPYAGVLIDRYNRKTIIILSNLLRAFVVPVYLLAHSADTLWIIYAVTIVQFTLSALFEPAQSAILPSMLRQEDLITGNTLMSVTWSAMLAFGAALGGVFAVQFGASAALLFDALTFLVATSLTAWARYTPKMSESEKTNQVVDTSFMEGIRYIRTHPAVFWTLLVKGITGLASVDTLMSVLATQVFVLGAKGELSLSILYSAFGVGAFLGPVVLNRWNDGSVRRMSQFILIGFIFALVSWFLMGVSASLLFLAGAIFIRGVGGSVNWTFSSVVIQKIVPDHYLGRMFSLDFAIFQAMTIIGIVLHGAILDWVGIQSVHIILFGTGFVCVVPLMLWWRVMSRLHETPESTTYVVFGD